MFEGIVMRMKFFIDYVVMVISLIELVIKKEPASINDQALNLTNSLFYF
jgi:hypothetical protein